MDKNKKAFTLIELLVVIAIIAMLLAIIVPSLGKAKESARLALCKNNLHQWAVAIGSWATDHNDSAPLSTTYRIDGVKVTQSFPSEMYLDQYDGQLKDVFGPLNSAQEKKWQKLMISQEGIAPYLPGFNDKGMRFPEQKTFENYPDNWELEGVWKCPSQKKRELDFIMSLLASNAYGTRSFFRLDYAYFGRADLWHDDMIPVARDRSSLVEKYPASGRVMLTDAVFYWSADIVWYNHGSEGPSYDMGSFSPAGQLSQTRDPKYITGMNEAYGDGSVNWKKIDSDDRFRLTDDGFFDNVNNRYMDTGGGAKMYY